MAEMIKLTLRLPLGLHGQIKRSALELNRSLNAMIVETLKKGLTKEITYEETERDKTLRVIRESGLLEPMGPIWDEEIAKAPDITYEELWKEMEGVPPLSEVIIAEREPR
ncbi:MAG: Arc family DNA-binding protein [Chloroflexi bacterium]|nr:Arc family DNA-binding protein [Chloroflexota bacterium]